MKPVTLKFTTKGGHEGELEVAELLSVDGIPYAGPDLDTGERICRLEGAVDLILGLLRGEEE